MTQVDPIFGEVIYSYSRRQAIEDGVLVQLSGPGYVGDAWVPKMVAEAGIRFPLAMTIEAFSECVALTKAAERAGQDIKGRLWDVLWMMKLAIRASRDGQDQIVFTLYVSRTRRRPERVQLKAIVGPGDQGEPVITIMYPHQD